MRKQEPNSKLRPNPKESRKKKRASRRCETARGLQSNKWRNQQAQPHTELFQCPIWAVIRS